MPFPSKSPWPRSGQDRQYASANADSQAHPGRAVIAKPKVPQFIGLGSVHSRVSFKPKQLFRCGDSETEQSKKDCCISRALPVASSSIFVFPRRRVKLVRTAVSNSSARNGVGFSIATIEACTLARLSARQFFSGSTTMKVVLPFRLTNRTRLWLPARGSAPRYSETESTGCRFTSSGHDDSLNAGTEV
jgi:hypothetical protein